MPSDDNPRAPSHTLGPEQRALFDLLRRGRTYEEAATALAIDTPSVRSRVLEACDTLVEPDGVAPERRQIIADFLLEELPGATAADVAERLSESVPERDYALRLRTALTPWFGDSLAELHQPAGAESPRSAPGASVGEPGAPVASVEEPPRTRGSRRRRRPSRVALAVLGGALVAVAVAVGVIALTGGSPHSATTTASTPTAAPVKQLARLTLTSPDAHSKAVGLAEVIQQGGQKGIVLAAANVPANSTRPRDAYALWLYNSSSDVRLLGWVQSPVGKNGRLSTEGLLPGDAAKYHYVMLSLETDAKPAAPSKIILGGKLSGV